MRSLADTPVPQSNRKLVRTQMKIFLVEDAPHICERLKELIEAQGEHRVMGCADNQDAAVHAIAAAKPDVAIFDIHLKRGNGIDALAEAKRLVPQLVGIVMSNNLTPQHRVLASEAGAFAVLDKSDEFDRIPEILSALLQQ
jgi:two-component system OmpR family response regulator